MAFWPGLLLGVVAGLGIATVIIAIFRDKEKGERHSQGPTARSRSPITYPTQPDDDDDNTCVVCLDYDANTFFEPCGHFCCCAECASKLKECPLCRRIIKTKTKPDATYKTLCQMDAAAAHEKSA